MRARILAISAMLFATAAFSGTQDTRPEAKSLTQKHKDLMPALIEALKDPDAEVRENVAEAIMALGVEAVPALIEVVNGKDAEMRVVAARLLGSMAEHGVAEDDAIPCLIKGLKDQEAQVRQATSFALARIILMSAGRRGVGGGGGF